MYKLIDKKGWVETSDSLKELHDIAISGMTNKQGESDSGEDNFIQILPKDGYIVYIENEEGDIAYKIEDTNGKFDKIPSGLFGEIIEGGN